MRSRIIPVSHTTSTPSMEWTPERVRKLRRQLRLSQRAFGDRLGVRQATVSDWERGKTAPTGPSVKLLEMIEVQARGQADGLSPAP